MGLGAADVRLKLGQAGNGGGREQDETGEDGDLMRALLLPEIKLVGQPNTLITPRVGFKERQKVTLIRVRSGDRVGPGTALMEIDPRRQEAMVATLESQLAVRQADLQQARQESERMKKLLEVGAASQAEAEQVETALAEMDGSGHG